MQRKAAEFISKNQKDKNMKKLFILLSLTIGLFFVSNANAQTKVVFAKGSMSKTMTVTVKAKGENKYSITVKKGQVINVDVEGDIQVSKTEEFPVIYLGLQNGVDGVDNSQDGEGYLSILAGKNGTYIFSVGNSDKKRARTFKLKVTVSNNREDFAGGEPVN
jgi:hypothetical protein